MNLSRGPRPDPHYLRPDEYVYQALRVGASGFLLKDTPLRRPAGRHPGGGRRDALLAPGITCRLIAEFARRPDPPTQVAPAVLQALTDRERVVLALVAHGLSNSEIAQRLVVSPATSKTYVSRLLAKLDARDRAQLVAIAYETGLVTPALAEPPRPAAKTTVVVVADAMERGRGAGPLESDSVRDGRCPATSFRCGSP